MKSMLKSVFLAAAFLASAAASAATDGHFYLGADIGSARSSVPGLIKTSATDFGVTAGYAYTKNFAFEVSHSDLGRVASTTAQSKTKVNDIAAVGTYNINDKSAVFGRLGYAMLDTSMTGSPVSTHYSATFGAGVSYSIADNIDLRAELDRYSLNSTDHINTMNIGARYTFK